MHYIVFTLLLQSTNTCHSVCVILKAIFSLKKKQIMKKCKKIIIHTRCKTIQTGKSIEQCDSEFWKWSCPKCNHKMFPFLLYLSVKYKSWNFSPFLSKNSIKWTKNVISQKISQFLYEWNFEDTDAIKVEKCQVCYWIIFLLDLLILPIFILKMYTPQWAKICI